MAVDADYGSVSPAEPDEADHPTPDKNRLFLRLFLQNQRRLYAYVLTLLPNRADADDVLQETSLTMWDKFDATEPPTEFLAWARRVAYHKVLDFNKKSNRAQARLSQIFLKRIAETAAGQADALKLDERRDALATCIEKLPGTDRDLLTRRFADGATTQSTSEQVGRSVDAVYKALAKVREALMQCVQKTLTQEGRA
ncbi:sigma-70 family RNA polymerase sigma factor [Gemmata sp. G18]|uniref:Sigma-70 family RNA polymerase sigma factor n=1 Tax=Gemmata palustris TaxID=2822762 RepID=A0ABS5BLU8_9BACT|nr:sigma-70 family RNA polymerase sigma factor [Gemmata palustris]MBP3954677.1 sigma-70 family RNA polymerase sigma factor [Gemmata palustris]